MKVTEIESIHNLFCELTNAMLTLNYMRDWAWSDFLRRGYTKDDLCTVVNGIKRDIKIGRRYPGALKWSNLIADVNKFEEELSEYRSRGRKKAPSPAAAAKASVLRSAGRPEPDAPRDSFVPVKDVIAAMRIAANKA